MPNNYSLSVIIPNYNNEKFIEKCIDSIFQQTCEPLEVIVIDDCSTDNSYNILMNLMKKYPKLHVYKQLKNSGVSSTRNLGLQRAKGEYVTFLDADDFYGNDKKLENEMNLIKFYKEKYDKDIIAYSKVMVVSNDENEKFPAPLNKSQYINGKATFDLLTEKNFKTIMRDYCINKNLLLSIGGYNTKRNFYEDLELLLKLSEKSDFYCTFEYGTFYRNSISGLSKRSKKESHEVRKKIYDEFEVKLSFWSKNWIHLKRLINRVNRKIKHILKIEK